MATTIPPPAPPEQPPAGLYPPPSTTPGPAPPSRGRRGAVVGIVAGLMIVLALVGAGYFFYVQPKSDAQNVLKDARPLVTRSMAVSRRAQTDVARFMRTGRVQVRQRAVKEINQTIAMRQRAIRKLGGMSDISFPGDSNYKRATNLWVSELRGSNKALGALRAVMPAKPSTGYLENRGEATLVAGQTLYLRRWEQLLRRTDSIVADLL